MAQCVVTRAGWVVVVGLMLASAAVILLTVGAIGGPPKPTPPWAISGMPCSAVPSQDPMPSGCN